MLTTLEEFDCDDNPARSIALRAASLVGIDRGLLESLHTCDVVSANLNAVGWLRLALDAHEARERDVFGRGLWAAMFEEDLG